MAENSIENFTQNHPELIVEDLSDVVDKETMRRVLKYRGVNKWLCNRRLLIALKNHWKEEITRLQKEYEQAKANGNQVHALKLKTRMNTLMDVRQQVRAICHSPRDVEFPLTDWGEDCKLPDDFPTRPDTKYFLKRKSKKEE